MKFIVTMIVINLPNAFESLTVQYEREDGGFSGWVWQTKNESTIDYQHQVCKDYNMHNSSVILAQICCHRLLPQQLWTKVPLPS